MGGREGRRAACILLLGRRCRPALTPALHSWGAAAVQASPPDDVLLAVAAGDHFTCGIRAADGALRCWGSASFGKTTPPGRGPFAQVSLGGSSACAVARNGSLRCFGDGRSAQTDPPPGTYMAVSVGTAHACALRAPPASPQQRGAAAAVGDGVGEAVCWGSHAERRAAAPPGRFKSVCAGGRHSCAVAAGAGRVVCWGSDSDGQLRAPPEVMTSVTCGHAHTCGIKVPPRADATHVRLPIIPDASHVPRTPHVPYPAVSRTLHVPHNLPFPQQLPCTLHLPCPATRTCGIRTSVRVPAPASSLCLQRIDCCCECAPSPPSSRSWFRPARRPGTPIRSRHARASARLCH